MCTTGERSRMEEFRIKDGVLEAYVGRAEEVLVPEGVHTIGEGAFKACVSLRRTVLPASLRRILTGAFKGCRKLQEVEIPAQVSYVGDYAFHRCHALKKISLPAGVEALGDCVFLYCDSLTEVRMPGVKRLGKQVFVNDVLLEKLEISRELDKECICDVFTGCGMIREIAFSGGTCERIPNAVEAVAGEQSLSPLVRAIAVDVLRMMELKGRCLVRFLTNLKHVEIPEGIEVLGKSCFFDRRGILSVSFPESLKEIESRAFRNCINLEKVVFGGAGVMIQEDAFKNCSSLKYVQIGGGPVYEFDGIERLSDQETPELVRLIQRQVLGNFRISGRLLFQYLGAESRVVVPEGIEYIAEEAFAGNEAVDRVILPKSLKSIGAYAFKNCLLLQTVMLPEGLEEIGRGAFANCVKLIRLHLPDPVTKVEAETFKHCRVLREVAFGPKLAAIGEQAFYKCLLFKDLQIPENLLSIGQMAFYGCTGLKEVRIPATVRQVGSLAFAGSGVRRAWIGSDGRHFGPEVFGDCKKLKALFLEEGAVHISDKLAFGCGMLSQVALPGTIRSVGSNVWEETPFLAKWTEQVQEDPGNIGAIFWDGRWLEGPVQLPKQVRIVAGGAFYGNQNITRVHLPAAVSWVGPAAFKGCRALREVVWPAGLAKVEPEVFSGCTELERIRNGEEERPLWADLESHRCLEVSGESDRGYSPVWQSVGERAFYRCVYLKETDLTGAEYIGKEAFSGCRVLRRSPVNHKVRIEERAFEDTGFTQGEAQTLPVAGGVILSGDFCEGEIRLPEGITRIAPYAFAGNQKIQKVIFPDSLEQIGEGAFFGCSSLLEVFLPKSLCSIEGRAFEKCISLKQIETSAVQVGQGAFAFCTGLSKAVLYGVPILAPGLFEGCRSLKQCVCERAEEAKERSFLGCRSLEAFDHSRLGRIGVRAFEGCDHLKSVELSKDVCVEPYGFGDCGRLERIVLSKNRIRLKEYAFSGCTAIRQVELMGTCWEFAGYADLFRESFPQVVRQIFYSALSCFQVKQEQVLTGYTGAGRMVKIPSGIRRIEAEVFRDVLTLEEIEIPDSVEMIGARAFHGTRWMERQRAHDPMVTVRGMLLDGSGCRGEVTILEEISLICGWAFAGGLGIEKIRFQSDRVRVMEYAFRNCIFLKELEFPDGRTVTLTGLTDREKELDPLAKQVVMDRLNCFKTAEDGMLVECTGNIPRLLLADGITSVGEEAFGDSNLLTEVIFPKTVQAIGRRAFAGCKWLRKVESADGVKKIGEQAFLGCGRLETAEFSENLQELGARAFEHCTSLREILLPEGLVEIPPRAFYRCHSLAKVQIPSTLKRIGKEAFGFCRGLAQVELPDNVVVEERAFAGCGGIQKAGPVLEK